MNGLELYEFIEDEFIRLMKYVLIIIIFYFFIRMSLGK